MPSEVSAVQHCSTLPVSVNDANRGPPLPTIHIWHLLALISSAATAGFVSLSMAGIGVHNRYAMGTEVQSAAIPTYFMLFVWGTERVLAILWCLRLIVAGKADIANAALPYFVAKCVFLSGWNACSLVNGTAGLIAELACLVCALGCCVAVYTKQRTLLTHRRCGHLVADVYAGVSIVVWTFCVGVVAMTLVVHVQKSAGSGEVLPNDIQLSIPNLLAGMVALILVVYSRDAAAPVCAIACALAYNKTTLTVVAGTIHVVLFIYAIVRRSRVCT